MNVTITYFPHSTTLDNENDVATGWLPGELSETGKKQAVELGQQINTLFAVVFSSDLKRTTETAQLAFGSRFDVIADRRLREANYGEWNGKPNKFKDQLKDYIDTAFPGGESYKDVENRMRSFLNDVNRDYTNKQIAVIGHQGTQLALEVITKDRSWQEAIANDWRRVGKWQAGWEYHV